LSGEYSLTYLMYKRLLSGEYSLTYLMYKRLLSGEYSLAYLMYKRLLSGEYSLAYLMYKRLLSGEYSLTYLIYKRLLSGEYSLTYLINKRLLSNHTRAKCTSYNIMWSILSVTCNKSVVSPDTPVTSTNKTDRHNITEILLKVVLNIISLIHPKYSTPQIDFLCGVVVTKAWSLSD
jgi:hypothetical protein